MSENQKFYTLVFLAALPLTLALLYIARDFFISLVPPKKTLILCPLHASLHLKLGDLAVLDSERCVMCDFDKDAA